MSRKRHDTIPCPRMLCTPCAHARHDMCGATEEPCDCECEGDSLELERTELDLERLVDHIDLIAEGSQ